MKRITTVLMALALALCFTVTAFPADANANSRTKVRIGYNDFSGSSNRKLGVDGTYLLSYYDKISKITGWDYEIVEAEWVDCLSMLESGEIDILGFVTKTPEREKIYDFTTMDAGISLTTLFADINNTELSYNDFTALDGKKVGVQSSNADVAYLEEYCKNNRFSLDIIYYDKLDDGLNDMHEGKLDLILGTNFRYSEREQIICQFAPAPFYFAASKQSSPEIYKQLENAVNKIEISEPNYEQKLYERYFNKDNQILINFSKNERTIIAKSEPLKVVYDASMKPLSYTDSTTGAFAGVFADVFNQISEFSGLQFEYIAAENYARALGMIETGEADLICNVDSQDSPRGMLLSDNYMNLSLNLVKNENYNDEDNSVAVALQHISPKYIEDIIGKSIVVENYDTLEDCIYNTYMGYTSCTIGNSYVTDYIINEGGYHSLSVITLPPLDATVCIGMNRTCNEDIIGIINKSLLKITSTDINDMLINNAMKAHDTSIFTWIKANPLATGIFSIVLCIIVFIFIIDGINRRKGRVIEQKSADIEKANAERQKLMERYGSELYHSFESVYEFDYITNEAFYLGQSPEGFKLIKLKDITPQKALLIWTSRCEDEEIRVKMFRQANADAIDRLFTSGKDELTYTTRIMPKNENNYVWYTVSIRRLVWNESERKIMICCKNVDSTIKEHNEKNKMLREALAAAERANKAKTEFLSRMSHDIRTPINAITGMATIAKERIDDKQFVLDCLDKTLSSSHYLMGLLSEILDMARIDGGQIKLNRERFKMSEFCDSVGLLFAERAYLLGLNFTATCDDKFDFIVVGDILRMKQILSNLLNNSFKFTPAGGNVRLDIKLEELYDNQCVVRFDVTDTGCGISQEHLKRIFEPFEQEKSGSDSRTDGTGLGLSIVKRLTTLLGGTVSVQSEKDKGAVFTVTMPFDISKSDAPAEKIILPEYEFHHQKVLIVDDNELNVDITKVLLEGSNLDVETAENGKVAYDMFCNSETGYYDIILMDIRMPVMDGREATRLIRALDRPDAKTIPIIAVSADAFADEIKYSQRIGMNDYIVKPVNRSELENAMGRLIYKDTD